MSKFILVLALLVLVGISSAASCASNAYSNACASCSFDTNGKIDKSCQEGYQSSGTACMSTSYPIMAAKYADGKCPQVDACAAELQSCASQYSSGNDRADCQEGSVAVCYAAADSCVQSAAAACGEIQNPCPAAPTFLLLLVGAGALKIRN